MRELLGGHLRGWGRPWSVFRSSEISELSLLVMAAAVTALSSCSGTQGYGLWRGDGRPRRSSGSVFDASAVPPRRPAMMRGCAQS